MRNCRYERDIRGEVMKKIINEMLSKVPYPCALF